ncbi:hypothetical protein ACF0H5_019869 [Mactra antiquata]
MYCPEQCDTCGRQYEFSSDPTYEICYKCKDGYHNGSSTNCLCPINCQKCTSIAQCTLCYRGWYGTKCESSCSPNCKDQTCRKSDGMCTNGCITEAFIGEYCNDCRRGLYGDNCHLSCSSNCMDNTCSKSDGLCIYGCSSPSFVGDDCNNCRIGFYGDNCDASCPPNCKDNVCTKTSGHCKYGCKSDKFDGIECNVCKTGFHGKECNLECPNNCKLINCSRLTGECTQECTETKVVANSTALIVGWIFGGCCFTLTVVLVSYICHLRHAAKTESERDVGHNENQATYVKSEFEIVTVRPEQANTYEDLNRRTYGETSVYSDLQ